MRLGSLLEPLQEHTLSWFIGLYVFCRKHLLGLIILSLPARLQKVGYAYQEQMVAEGLGDIGVSTMLIALDALRLLAAGGKQNDRNMTGHLILLDLRTEGESVHHRHHHIADNQVGHTLLSQTQTILSIRSLDDIVLTGKEHTQIAADILIVVDDKNGGQFLHILLQQHLMATVAKHMLREFLLASLICRSLVHGIYLFLEVEHIGGQGFQLSHVAQHHLQQHLLLLGIIVCLHQPVQRS